jgi:transposase
MDSLAAVVQERLRLDPFSGAVFVFRAKRAEPATFGLPFSVGQDRISVASTSR